MSPRKEEGSVYLCSTPIGNLEDITLRVLRILQEADLIAAEDTRHTIKLLNHFDIKTPLTSYHQHNERDKSSRLIRLAKEGKCIALVTDAGMPGISDPGAEMIQQCIQEGVSFTLLPGANAALTGLVLSGLSTKAFVFEGFLSREKGERKIQWARMIKESRTIILYESPVRVLRTLKEALKFLGNRNIALARELTKHYEEVWRGSIQKAIEAFQGRQPKGEFVLIVEGLSQEQLMAQEKAAWTELTIDEHLQYYREQDVDHKEAMKKVARDRGLTKREVYRHTIK